MYIFQSPWWFVSEFWKIDKNFGGLLGGERGRQQVIQVSAKLGWAQYDFVYLDKLFSVYCYVYVIGHGEHRSKFGDFF